MANTVIAFVGQNANGILDYQSQRFNALLQPYGLHGHVLRVSDPDFIRQLDRGLQDDVLFAWGYAGVGANLALNGRNIWDSARLPFISVLADPPYMMPSNHHVPSPNVVNGYVYREWLEFQQSHVRSPQIAGLLPMGVIPNPDCNRLRWFARPTRMLFVKTGNDPGQQRTRWVRWPARLRVVLHDCADILAARGTGDIVGVVQACLAAHDLVLDGSKRLLFGLMHELDTYIRSVRSTAIAKALLPLPVDIVGDGWAHLQGAGAARFHPAMDAAGLDARYAETQILVNATPNLSSGAHERVLRGFAARCCVVSDDNDHARAHLHALPSYHGVEWHEPDLADRLAAVFHDPTPYDDRLDDAQAYVERHHDSSRFLEGMMELAQLVRLQPVMSGYALEAA